MNKVKLLSSIASAVLLASSATWAAAPAGYGGFDQWSVSTGTISISDLDSGTGGVQTCPSGWTCGAATTGNGFYQRQVSDGTNRYFQTIISEMGATGAPGVSTVLPFADESFVKINANGLAGKQSLLEVETDLLVTPNLETTVRVASELGSGWAGTATHDTLQVDQSLIVKRQEGASWVESLSNTYGLTQSTRRADGVVTAKEVILSQMVETKNGGTANDRMDDDLQKFLLHEVALAGGIGGQFTLPGTPDPLIPQTLDFLATDGVKVTWVGQTSVLNGSFSYQSYGKTAAPFVTDPDYVTNRISYFSTATSSPFNWYGDNNGATGGLGGGSGLFDEYPTIP